MYRDDEVGEAGQGREDDGRGDRVAGPPRRSGGSTSAGSGAPSELRVQTHATSSTVEQAEDADLQGQPRPRGQQMLNE